MWTQAIWAMLYINKGTNSPFMIATDFSSADTIEGIMNDAKRVVYNSIERIMEETIKRRQKMGSKVVDLPNKIYFTVKIRTNPPVKKRLELEIGG